MLGWVDDIEKITDGNDDFRRVVFTGGHAQLVLMSLRPDEEIGWESHDHLDQFFRIEVGRARVDLGTTADHVDESHQVEADWAFIVPAGTWHNVTNVSEETVKLYTIYSPPEHPDGTVHATKAEAEAAELH